MTQNREAPRKTYTREERKELERQLSQWLEEQEAQLLPKGRLEDQREEFLPRGVSNKYRFDALVLGPVPAAFELFFPDMMSRMRFHQYKHLLPKRISLAQRFGPYFPLIYVIPDNEDISKDDIPFVDAVFEFSKLPPLADLPNVIKLDAVTQTILERGDPGDVEFTSEQEFEVRWSRSTPFYDLVKKQQMPANTLAQRIIQRRTMMLSDRRSSRREETRSPEKQLSLFEERIPVEPPPTKTTDKEERERARARQLTHRCIEEEIGTFLSDHLHAEREDVRVPLSVIEKPPMFRFTFWEVRNGKRFVIRHAVLPHPMRVKDLGAEAWIVRALSPYRIDTLVALVTRTFAGEDESLERINLPWDVSTINELEAWGWKVFPWDFTEEEPQFFEYLRELGQD